MPFNNLNEPLDLEPGLYVVATPIGNLGDMTLRGIRTLMAVDIIAAEDTRVSKKLLNHYGISGRLISCHEHNEYDKSGYIVSCIERGESVALISDAGTPLISDPGFHVVKAVAEAGLMVSTAPGSVAAIAALSISGMPTDAFTFTGFSPSKQGKRIAWLSSYADVPHPVICYESPHRIIKLLDDAVSVLGDRYSVLCRELTKRYEEVMRGSLCEIKKTLEAREVIKGEIVLIISGKPMADHQSLGNIDEDISEGIKAGESASRLAKRLSKEYGVPKNDVYSKIVDQKDLPGD